MDVFIELPSRCAAGAGSAGGAWADGPGASLWVRRGGRDEPGRVSGGEDAPGNHSCRDTAGEPTRSGGKADAASLPAIPDCDWDLDEPEPYAVATHAYQEELAFDRRRTRRRRLARIARFALACVLVPIAALVVFVAAYALAFIMNGATLEQLVQALIDLAAQIQALVEQGVSYVASQWDAYL